MKLGKKTTINVTPTWSGLLPTILMMLESNKAESRKIGMEQLEKMAKGADLWNEHVDSLPPSDKHSHIIAVDDIVNVDESDDNIAFTGKVTGFENGKVLVDGFAGNKFEIEPTDLEVRH